MTAGLRLLQARRLHTTKLVDPGPCWQRAAALGRTLTNARVIHYQSGDLRLQALYRPPPPSSTSGRAPALLYLHGGWALKDDHLREVEVFAAAGFAVLAPSYRGENGNPGAHEMLWGELDDALAALAWLRAQVSVDASRVFVFGHSAGGMLAALMACEPELPVRLGASINGIYGPEVFDVQRLPFADSPRERELRLLAGHIEDIEQPHVAFVGRRDPALAITTATARRAAELALPFEAVIVAGDHYASIAPAAALFLDCARRVI